VATAEIRDYVARDKALVIYHHFHRNGSHPKQIQELLKRVSLDTDVEAWGIRFGAVSPRVYIVIPTARHRVKLKERLLSFANGKCREPFQLETYGVD
jgi:predicted aldo/keto reductase-like oxidoreductase